MKADIYTYQNRLIWYLYTQGTPQIPQPPQGGTQNQYTQNYGSQINGNYINNGNSQGGFRNSQKSQQGEGKGLPNGWFWWMFISLYKYVYIDI